MVTDVEHVCRRQVQALQRQEESVRMRLMLYHILAANNDLKL
jgi:hypothetical protein